jgi:hypothetical protein
MSMTMEMSPLVGEAEVQTEKEFSQVPLSRCECLFCKGLIEFAASAFREKFRTKIFIVGQKINCPHCDRTTSIYMDDRPGKVATVDLSKA